MNLTLSATKIIFINSLIATMTSRHLEEKTPLIDFKASEGSEQQLSNTAEMAGKRENSQTDAAVEKLRHDSEKDLEELKYKCQVNETILKELGLI